jgi:hypothetical protein
VALTRFVSPLVGLPSLVLTSGFFTCCDGKLPLSDSHKSWKQHSKQLTCDYDILQVRPTFNPLRSCCLLEGVAGWCDMPFCDFCFKGCTLFGFCWRRIVCFIEVVFPDSNLPLGVPVVDVFSNTIEPHRWLLVRFSRVMDRLFLAKPANRAVSAGFKLW